MAQPRFQSAYFRICLLGAIALTIVALVIYLTLPRGTALQEQRAILLDTESTRELTAAFDRLHFDLDAVRVGRQAVPRVYVVTLPEDLSETADISLRKSAFLRSLLPLVLMANEELREKRGRVAWMIKKRDRGQSLTESEQVWLAATIDLYGAGGALDLLERVDLLPAALVLAQGIEESGWGQSRFAQEGNALFGQRIWGPGASGLDPQNAGDEEKFRVRSYEDLMASVRSYMHNLNSHPAYERFRAFRAARRRDGMPLRAEDVLTALDGYSEEAALYRERLTAIIRGNRLEDFRDARLAAVERSGRGELAALWKETPAPVALPKGQETPSRLEGRQ